MDDQNVTETAIICHTASLTEVLTRMPVPFEVSEGEPGQSVLRARLSWTEWEVVWPIMQALGLEKHALSAETAHFGNNARNDVHAHATLRIGPLCYHPPE